ncbi:MAG: DUF6268 family outer membrane beta-barrel protein [Bacteroidia bacterium]
MNLNKISILSIVLLGIGITTIQAQEEEEDYSQYANVETTGAPTKTYCTSKIIGGSPSKLISFGYDFQGPNTITAGQKATSFLEQKADIDYNSGLRVMASIPVISNTKWIVTLGANIAETKYAISSDLLPINPLISTLRMNGLTTMGLNTTIFKPLNAKNFILTQASADWNGDYALGKIPDANQLKVSAAVLYGWKKTDKLMYAIGVSRTYRGGQQLYVPLVLYNRTINSKWGVECLLPARGNIRYTVNSRNMLFAGFELEGNSYRLNNMMKYSYSHYSALELRRSEIRARLTYEFSVYKFWWLSVQAGYRVNYKFNMDDGEFYGRKKDFVAENSLTNPFYMMVTLNLVSP